MTDAAAPEGRNARQRGVLGAIERFGDRLPDPVMIFVWLIAFIFVLSAVGAALGWNAVNPVSGETISAQSMFASANLQRLFEEMPRTLTGFAPLGYVLLVMLGAGLAERSGLFGAAMRAMVKDAPKFLLTPIVVFVGIMANQAADAAYVVLIPLAGVMFAAAGRHPIVGIAAGFAGVAAGFSANLLPGQLDALLLGITEPAARLLVPDWTMNVAGNWYFIAGMTVLFTPIAWFVTDVIVEPRLGKWTPSADAPIETSSDGLTAAEKKGLGAAGLAALGLVVFFALLTIPSVWTNQFWQIEGGAPLYDEAKAAEGLPEQALSPFYHSLVAAFFLLFLVCGIAYGRAAGVNKTHRDEIKMISDGMATMSYYIILAFAAAHFVALFNWSNLGAITAIHGARGLEASGLPAPALLGAILLLGTTINLAIGSASAKWAMLAPVLVPMLMLLGISPEMTTAAYRMGDSITNPVTPLMVYFPLVLTFCQRWDKDFGMGGLMAVMIPYSLWFLVFGMAMTVGWVFLDLPLGPGAQVSYEIPAAAPAQ